MPRGGPRNSWPASPGGHRPLAGRPDLTPGNPSGRRGGPSNPAERLRLTPTEWAILELLLQRPGQLVGSAQLLTSVWGPGFQECTNYLRFHMARLRRKLEDNPHRPRHLLTEPGMGYRHQPEARPARQTQEDHLERYGRALVDPGRLIKPQRTVRAHVARSPTAVTVWLSGVVRAW
jgi:DNA-binding winged helix-turn-helix (wHTH) protein